MDYNKLELSKQNRGEKTETKVALVTGSSKGIGQAIATRLGSEGYFTYVTYRTDKEGGLETVEAIKSKGGAASVICLDVRSEDSVRAVFKKVMDEQEHLNILINNAAIEIPKTIEDASFEDWRGVTETKINGSFLCTKYALSLLKGADNANVIFITASYDLRPSPTYLAYSVGSAGVSALAKALALQLGKYGIRTNAISPSATKTHMWDVLGGDDEALWQRLADNNPMKRVCTTEDVTNAVMLIIFDQSRFLNGNTIYVNGGRHLK